MTPAADALLARVRALGGTLELGGDGVLNVELDDDAPEELWAELAAHKRELLALLELEAEPSARRRATPSAGG